MTRLTVINAHVFDGAERTEGPVHMENGVIVQVGGAAPATDQVIDARGGTVIPGLIDAHCHAYAISLDPLVIETNLLSYVALIAAQRLRAALARGFTTIRDVAGGDPGLAKAISEGVIASPRYFYTGPALSQTGGHGDPRAGDRELCGCGSHMSEVVDGVDAVRQAVRERFRRGAHAIKVLASGGVISPTDPIRNPQYSAEELRAITDEAARRGSYVAAHAYSPEAIVHAVTNGVRTIEHGNLLDTASAAVMAEHGAYLVPTLAPYDAMDRRGPEMGLAPASQEKNKQVLESGRKAIELAVEAGVPVGFGSDLMGSLEDEQLNGLRLQVEVTGIRETLRSATRVNADILGRPDLGRIEPGAAGDLVILPGDVLENPSLLWDGPRTVILAGKQA
ncbi:amidohydrolase family protein [Nonomuraea sp. NPDC050556]|uniref:metal-dependent hydrolase family protein n=1 Tax=Nonomuraea sp. NPDC050556 TaxID=3364369 RepID=UPI0037A7D7C9